MSVILKLVHGIPVLTVYLFVSVLYKDKQVAVPHTSAWKVPDCACAFNRDLSKTKLRHPCTKWYDVYQRTWMISDILIESLALGCGKKHLQHKAYPISLRNVRLELPKATRQLCWVLHTLSWSFFFVSLLYFAFGFSWAWAAAAANSLRLSTPF